MTVGPGARPGRSVLVSSQNWSSAGTLSNRDAGVILHGAEAAAYFDRIFLHDWEHLASRKTAVDGDGGGWMGTAQ